MRGTLLACLLVVSCGCVASGSAASPSAPAEWALHDAAGLRIATPASWGAPEVLPATDATGGPRAWIVFRDPSGVEAVTLMTWGDASADAVAAAQHRSELPQGDRRDLTLGDAGRTRAAIAVTAYARWSDANGAGTYECRHLFVQVDPRLVADVIACGAHIKGNATPVPELVRAQDQVALRLGVAGGAP